MQDTSTQMDKAAIGLSLVCVVHCLLVPIAIIMVPALGASFLDDERFHFALLYLVLPTSLIALGLGCRQHGRVGILLLGVLGLSILCLILIISEEVIEGMVGELGEKIATIIGSSIIAYAHLLNFRRCRSTQCESPDAPASSQ